MGTNKNSSIHFDDGSHADIQIPTKTYVAPDGTQWRTNPIPGCACDNGLSCGGKDSLEKSRIAGNHSHGASLYVEGSCSGQYPKSTVSQRHGSATSDCPRGTLFEAGFDQFTQGFLVGASNKFSVMDEVQVPNKPGEHQVLRAHLARVTISVFSRTATTSQGLVNWTRRHATAHAAQDPAHHRHPAKEIICAGLASAMKSPGMEKWIRTHARAPAQRLKS